ncbi:MAG: radical SAM protein [Pseudomonadota bacterium]
MNPALKYEQGPIRPPSEAGSLLLRVTRNCPWNKCAFCATYKNRKFSRRSLEEIFRDVDAVKGIVDQIIGISRQMGDGGQLTRRVLVDVVNNPDFNDCYRSTALWLASGGHTVFLQDANSIMLSTESLIAILGYVREIFPDVVRVTSYARAGTLKNKSVEDFVRLREAGLARLHVGMESGSDRVLKLIQKGARAEQIIEGGKKVVEAGISLCLYIIPGIGGREFSEENAIESARVVNAINPAFVRFRSLYVKRGTTLSDMVDEGRFTIPDEDEIVLEIKRFIGLLEGITTTLVSDHILNLLQEVEGKLPEDKPRILSVIDKYLGLPEEERLLFQLGRRGVGLTDLDQLNEPGMKARLRQAKAQIENEMPGGIPEYISEMKRRFL